MVNNLPGSICLLGALLASATFAQDKPKIEFRDHDRIAFVGNEFFERDQERGYIETALTTRFPDKHLTFRNLGYSGDTVRGDARNLCAGWANFGPADQGFGRLKNLVEHIKPTLVFVAYGMNESFDGSKGLEPFATGLNAMLDMLASGGTRIVLISPIRHEDLGRPLPDPTQHNKNILLYIAAMEKVAQQRGYPLINLYEALGDGTKDSPAHPFTFDGIHLNPYGYGRVAVILEQGVGYPPIEWNVDIDAKGGHASATGTKLEDVKTSGNSVSFRATDGTLPLASPAAPKSLFDIAILPGMERRLRITGLAPGRYVLKSDEKAITSGDTADRWANGVQLLDGPSFDQQEQLRKLVVAKNFDFFNFWRPENDTYIFGYRKHEQGRNAVEIPLFEPLVAAKEAEIAKLRVPASHAYVLTLEPPK